MAVSPPAVVNVQAAASVLCLLLPTVYAIQQHRKVSLNFVYFEAVSEAMVLARSFAGLLQRLGWPGEVEGQVHRLREAVEDAVAGSARGIDGGTLHRRLSDHKDHLARLPREDWRVIAGEGDAVLSSALGSAWTTEINRTGLLFLVRDVLSDGHSPFSRLVKALDVPRIITGVPEVVSDVDSGGSLPSITHLIPRIIPPEPPPRLPPSMTLPASRPSPLPTRGSWAEVGPPPPRPRESSSSGGFVALVVAAVATAAMFRH